MTTMWSDCCGAKVNVDICSNCHKLCVGFFDDFCESLLPSESSDDGYDAARDNWVLGDEPMNSAQRRENDSWNETCRRESR